MGGDPLNSESTRFDLSSPGSSARDSASRDARDGALRDLAPRDRAPLDRAARDALPRELLLAHGSAALADVDLLTLLLGTGAGRQGVAALAAELLEGLGDIRVLADMHPRELLSHRGIGAAKATRLLAAVELGRRISSRAWPVGQSFESSRQVFAHCHPWLRDERRELFLAYFLDARHRLITEYEVSRGSLVASLVHPREVFRPAIRVAAAALIVVHNHPSGDPAPSPEDYAVTERLHRAGRLLGISLLDHVVVGDGRYVSFADGRLGPFRV